jgi:hypothetical protein
LADNLTFADVVAGVGTAIATYTHALDDGRTDDVVATFCPDGAVDMPGLGRHVGHDALKAAYEQIAPKQPQRHLVSSIHVTNWDVREASATSDVVLLVKNETRWTVAVVGRYDDVLRRDGDRWLFHSRTAQFTF